MKLLNVFGGKTGLVENVSYVLRDKDGNVKKLFKRNFLGELLAKFGINTPKVFLFGSYVDEMVIANLITDAGLAGVASRINGSGGENAFTYIAIGTGSTAAAEGDTTLQTEITTNGGERASATASRVTTTETNDTARLVYTFNFTGSFTVTESGVFNAASSGTLLARQVFTGIAVGNGDSLQITWSIDVQRP